MIKLVMPLLGMLIVTVAGIVGWYLDAVVDLDSRPLYWLIGGVGGTIGMGVALLGVLFDKEN